MTQYACLVEAQQRGLPSHLMRSFLVSQCRDVGLRVWMCLRACWAQAADGLVGLARAGYGLIGFSSSGANCSKLAQQLYADIRSCSVALTPDAVSRRQLVGRCAIFSDTGTA